MQAGPAEPGSLHGSTNAWNIFLWHPSAWGLSSVPNYVLCWQLGVCSGKQRGRGEAGRGEADWHMLLCLHGITELCLRAVKHCAYTFLYCVQRPGAMKYTLYGSCLVTVLLPCYFILGFFLYFQSIPLLMNLHKYWEHTYKWKNQFSILPLGAFS